MKKIKPFVLLMILTTSSFAAEYQASLDYSERINLSLPVSGVIKEMNATVGQVVSFGDVLLSLDQTPFLATIAHAKSRIHYQQAVLTQSLRDLKNKQELYDRTVLSTVNLENAELEEKRNRALLIDAEAQLKMADYQSSYSKLSAPFDALIVSIQVNKGQSINNTIQSKTLLTLVKINSYRASAFITPDKAIALKIGEPVKIKYQNRNYQGHISDIVFESGNTNNNKTPAHYRVGVTFKTKKPLATGHQATLIFNE